MRFTKRFKRLRILVFVLIWPAIGCHAGGKPSLVSPDEILRIALSRNADSLVSAYENEEMTGYSRMLLLSVRAYQLKQDSVTIGVLARSIPDTRAKVAVYLELIRLLTAEGPQDTTSRELVSIPERSRLVAEEVFSEVATNGPEPMRRFQLLAAYSDGHTSVSRVPDLLTELLAKQPEMFLDALARIDSELARKVVGQMEELGDWSRLQDVLSSLADDQRDRFDQFRAAK